MDPLPPHPQAHAAAGPPPGGALFGARPMPLGGAPANPPPRPLFGNPLPNPHAIFGQPAPQNNMGPKFENKISNSCYSCGEENVMIYTCQNHQLNVSMCFTCGLSDHIDCRIAVIQATSKNLQEGVKFIERNLEVLKDYLNNKMSKVIADTFSGDLQRLENESRRVKDLVQKSIDEGLYQDYNKLKQDIVNTQKSIHSSKLFTDISRHHFMNSEIRRKEENYEIEDRKEIPKNEDLEIEGERDEYLKFLKENAPEDYFTESYKNNKENYKLNLRLSDLHEITIFHRMMEKEIKIPNLKKLTMGCLGDKTNSLKSFFGYNFPDKVELFAIDRNDTYWNDIGDLMPELTLALKNVTREIFIRGYCFTTTDFEALMKASCNCKKVKLFDCKIDTSTPLNLEPEEPYQIEILDLERVGKYSKWDENPESVQNLIDGISGTSLNSSLKEIAISDCHIDPGTFSFKLSMKKPHQIQVTENADWDQED